MTGSVGIAPVAPAPAAAVAALRGRILAQHASGGSGLATAGLAAELFEEVVKCVWEAVLAGLPAATAAKVRRHAALAAVGGFGRREMAPYSDVDIMLLHDGRAPAAVAATAAVLLRDLFDAGLEVGQSVRTPGEALRLARGEATILASLLDMRFLTGRAELVAKLASRLAAAVGRRRRSVVARLSDSRREEADRFGRTVSLLEPNVKRSPGGLRDLQFIGWAGRVMHGAGSVDELVLQGRLSRADADALRDAAEFLTRVRIDLHLAAGRANDELTRAEQLRIAAERGLRDREGLLGVEQFMRAYFGHTRRVVRVRDALLRVIDRPGPLGRLAAGVLGNVADGMFRVGPFHVGAVPGREAEICGSIAAIVRLVDLARLHALGVEPSLWEAVRAAVPSLPRAPDPDACRGFLALFARPDGLAAALRRLHDAGVLEILVPGFSHARDLLQFNNYHKYTVDEHCILSVERAVSLGAADSWLGRTWGELTRRRPLLLALLFHDLGKGFAEDHSVVGARLAREAAARLGLAADEAEMVEFLVLKHLSMAHLAFRRDAGDDSLVVRFAREVGSPEVLRMLALLTAADMDAVGPGTWTRWKSDLLADLHYRTLEHLDGESPSRAAEATAAALRGLLADRDPDDPVARLARRLPPSYLRDTPAARIVEELGRLARLPPDEVFAVCRWQPQTGTVAVTVGTREDIAPGVFHRVAGALAAERLEVLAAGIHTLAGGLVLDQFVVLDPDFAGEPPAERFADVAAAIRAALKAEKPPDFSRRWNPFAPQLSPAVFQPVRVTIDNESSREATILEVFAHDSAGLLFRIAGVIFAAGLSVRAARIGTYLDQVVDAFHVTDARGGKLLDPERIADLRRAIEAAAAPPTRPG